MAPRDEDDWSESEDDASVSEIETSILLGVPDGEIDETKDLLDPAVSRIGGHPAFLPKQPLTPTDSRCKVCNQLMPLLAQIWCPFEGSAMDRALYIWGCERHECQRKDGSIRVWRGLKFNPRYSAKLAQKKAKEAGKLAKKAVDQAREDNEKKRRSVNPFSLSPDASKDMALGLGTQLFITDNPLLRKEDNIHDMHSSDSGSESGGDGNSVDALTGQLGSTVLESADIPTEWLSSPSYKSVYLSTISEYVRPPPKVKAKTKDLLDDLEDNKNAGRDWGLEGWESSMNVDPVFERFTKRVSSENEQCVRYELKGIPLAFGSRDVVYERLWPPPPPMPFTTKPGFAEPIIQRRTFDATAIDKCRGCGGPRVFECQLMPNLINVLRTDGTADHDSGDRSDTKETPELKTDEERRKRLLQTGMEWGTCFIFSCENDCCSEGEDGGWREELVLVQWDE